MPKTVKLSEWEQKKLHEQVIKLNKVLIGENRKPIQESELVHKILEQTITKTGVSASGTIIIN